MSHKATGLGRTSSEMAWKSLVKGRYRIVRELGRGAQGVVWLAQDLRRARRQVVLKIMSMSTVTEWKAVELFEREGRALAALDHPAIPAYLDSFHLEDAQGVRMVLVQEYVEGEDLGEVIEAGRRWTESRVREMTEQLLSILTYIHGLSPPIIHRDIKPSNIVLRSDGKIVLVDFGAAAMTLSSETGGSTVAGTSGFMPMEQLMGQAQPSSDLFAMGATLVHLLSHKHPSTLPMAKMRLQFRPVVNVSEGFCDFLEALLEPHVEDRVETASEALVMLRRVGQRPVPRRPKPTKSRVKRSSKPTERPKRAVVPSRASPMALTRPPWTDIECVWGKKTVQCSEFSATTRLIQTLRVVVPGHKADGTTSSVMLGIVVAGGLLLVFLAGMGPSSGVLMAVVVLFLALVWLFRSRAGAQNQCELVWSDKGLLVKGFKFGLPKTRVYGHKDIVGVDIAGIEASGNANLYSVFLRKRLGRERIASWRSLEECKWLAAQLNTKLDMVRLG